MAKHANLAVVARRSEPDDSLDYFPTPPWATRAFIETVLQRFHLIEAGDWVFEPACGEGHMAAVLAEYFSHVIASDIFDYGFGEQRDFLCGWSPEKVEWIITNPPFKKAEDFAERALLQAESRARVGVALLVRLQWLESEARERLFRNRPPAFVAVHSGRVAMTKGRWQPDASTATAYCWVVWLQPNAWRGLAWDGTRLVWIPADAKARFTRPNDAMRFGATVPAPLLEGMQ